MREAKRIRAKLAHQATLMVVETPGAAPPSPVISTSAQTAEIQIRKLTNRDADFYSLLGPFLANRRVAADLGMPAWDDPGKRWYVALQGGAVAGFAAVLVVKAKLQFCSAWVAPEKRSGGIYAKLVEERLADYKSQRLRATATELSKAALERYGFQIVKQKGKYFEMERPPER